MDCMVVVWSVQIQEVFSGFLDAAWTGFYGAGLWFGWTVRVCGMVLRVLSVVWFYGAGLWFDPDSNGKPLALPIKTLYARERSRGFYIVKFATNMLKY